MTQNRFEELGNESSKIKLKMNFRIIRLMYNQQCEKEREIHEEKIGKN